MSPRKKPPLAAEWMTIEDASHELGVSRTMIWWLTRPPRDGDPGTRPRLDPLILFNSKRMLGVSRESVAVEKRRRMEAGVRRGRPPMSNPTPSAHVQRVMRARNAPTDRPTQAKKRTPKHAADTVEPQDS